MSANFYNVIKIKKHIIYGFYGFAFRLRDPEYWVKHSQAGIPAGFFVIRTDAGQHCFRFRILPPHWAVIIDFIGIPESLIFRISLFHNPEFICFCRSIDSFLKPEILCFHNHMSKPGVG